MESRLIERFFDQLDENVRSVATDRFLGKSRDSYPAPWLAREIVQNFVDHNPGQRQGTLDGVAVEREALEGGWVRYRIVGHWPFPDPTALTALDSDKPGQQTAGGNGIGLKQTAIRLLRDYGVRHFSIEGEGWETEYRYLDKEHLVDLMSVVLWWNDQAKLDRSIDRGWLLGELTRKNGKRGITSYVIETDNPELKQVFDHLKDLGVSEENPYLQYPDFRNQHGAIKWLLPQGDTLERGRLFINGQVMHFRAKGKVDGDYWHGPEGVTVQLNGVDYTMSIDRPAVSDTELSRYMERLVGSMSDAELIEQLKRTQPLWASLNGYPTPGAGEVIEKLVRELVPYVSSKRRHYQPLQYEAIFGHGLYVVASEGMSRKQSRELEAQGYILCPRFFARLGMPSAESVLGSLDQLLVQSTPEGYEASRRMEQLATTHGVSVDFLSLPEYTDGRQFLSRFWEELQESVEEVKRDGDRFTFVVHTPIETELLAKPFLRSPTRESQQLRFIRGAVFEGLRLHAFESKSVLLSAGGKGVTFERFRGIGEKESDLLVRLVEHGAHRKRCARWVLLEQD